jgi:prepilin-type N-terminal cleavage/methylation domain-containing protein
LKKNSKTKINSGFSFVEISITVFIIGVVLILYLAAANTFRLTKTAKNQEIALGIASNKIEELRAGGYDTLPISGSFSDPQLSALLSGSGNMDITDYNSDTKQVQITIEWQEAGSLSARDVSLVTLITKTGGL